MKLTNVRLAPGAPGSMYHIELLEKENVDVLLAGESPQWETYEYARDAVNQGRKKLSSSLDILLLKSLGWIIVPNG